MQPLASVELGDDVIVVKAAEKPNVVLPARSEARSANNTAVATGATAETDSAAGTAISASIIEAQVNSPTGTLPLTKPDNLTWELAPISSHVVTPYQWVRFPVEVVSDFDEIDKYVLTQVDRLPNGASFDKVAGGGRQFQWRPRPSDLGEHQFSFTAIDIVEPSRREGVTMRIIVQE